jgi:leader peptidase (prepilin peptidase) / N-methyltransferase
MQTIHLILYAVLGLVIGSFLNVCIYRIPLRKSIVFPGSGCPLCGTPIRPYDNIPVLSFLLLRGKCRSCGKPISLQYPLVELLSCLAFFCCANTWQFDPPTYVNSIFLSVIIILIFADYNHQILPNVLTLPGIVAGIVLSSFTPEAYTDILSTMAASLFSFETAPYAQPILGSILGALIGGGPLYAVAIGYEKWRKKQGLGMGDVKMMAMVGAFLGWQLALLTILIGSLMGSLVGVFLILFRNKSWQTKLAFGVFLGIASAFSLFYGLKFLDLWFKFLDWLFSILQ